MNRKLIIPLILVFLSHNFCLAQNKTSEPNRSDAQMLYPELNVSPLASQRLDMEYKKEKKSESVNHLPLQVSAFSTLAASWYLGTINTSEMSDTDKDNVKYTSVAGMIIGAGWLGISYYLRSSYHPYEEGMRTIVGMPNKSTAENLARERMAEEAIMHAGELATKVKWISFASNFTASAMILSAASKDKKAQVAGGLAMLASFTPLIFPYSWEQVADAHRDYKKKIYGPVASVGLLATAEHQYAPGLIWSAQF